MNIVFLDAFDSAQHLAEGGPEADASAGWKHEGKYQVLGGMGKRKAIRMVDTKHGPCRDCPSIEARAES
jgi:hypothetical protein